METQKLKDGREVPKEIFEKACGIVMGAKSIKSVMRHTDVVDAIAIALCEQAKESQRDTMQWALNEIDELIARRMAGEEGQRKRKVPNASDDKIAAVGRFLFSRFMKLTFPKVAEAAK